MPMHRHGGSPLTKTQRRKRADNEFLLEQATGQAHHDVNAEPFNYGRWECAVDDHNAGRTPAPTTGGTLSFTEDAARLAAIAGNTAIAGAIQQAQADLQDGMNQAAAAMGDGHSGASDVAGAGNAALESLSNALGGELGALADQVMNLSSETFGAIERLMAAVNGAADQLS